MDLGGAEAWLPEVGASGLLAIVIGMIFTGRLVPKRYYDEALQRVAEEREVKEMALEANKGLVAMNQALVREDSNASMVIEAMRKEAVWARRTRGQDRHHAFLNEDEERG